MLINKKDGASNEECRHYQDFDCTLCGVTRHMIVVSNIRNFTLWIWDSIYNCSPKMYFVELMDLLQRIEIAVLLCCELKLIINVVTKSKMKIF